MTLQQAIATVIYFNKDEKDVLLKAAELLERDGWKRYSYGPVDPNEHAPRCALGAISAAAAYYDGKKEKKRRVAARQRVASQIHWTDIGSWNDQPGRQASEVVDALRKAADVH